MRVADHEMYLDKRRQKGAAAGPGLTFDGLTAPDMGKKTAIRLLLGLSGESSLFELRIEVHGPAIRAGV